MKLKLYSLKNDLLELDIAPVRPNLKVAELYFEGAWHPWHPCWEILAVKDFNEDFDVVQNKIIAYYKAEKVSCSDGAAVIRKPGHALLLTDFNEEWRLDNCKIVDCKIDEDNKTIALDLWFDGVIYKNERP